MKKYRFYRAEEDNQ